MRGDDVYWGPPGDEVTNTPPAQFHGASVTIEVPEEILKVNGGLKASYHASGQFHVKVCGNMCNGPERWPRKAEIDHPFRLGALITKPPIRYEPYTRSLTRRGANALVIRVPEQEAHLRHYCEFFLSPPGQFGAPQTLLKIESLNNDQLIIQSLSERFILVIRHLVFAETMRFHEWHPEYDLWLFARELVGLPEHTAVEFEPHVKESSSAPPVSEGLAKVYAILGERYDSGHTDTAARHDEHQP
jgi:hypothetical protein